MAGRAGDVDGIFLVLPLAPAAAMAIGQDHAVRLGTHLDRCHLLAVPQRLPSAAIARLQHALAHPAPHVEPAQLVRRRSGAVAPTVATAGSAHRLCRNHLANCTSPTLPCARRKLPASSSAFRAVPARHAIAVLNAVGSFRRPVPRRPARLRRATGHRRIVCRANGDDLGAAKRSLRRPSIAVFRNALKRG
jgi:hypothetical protein